MGEDTDRGVAPPGGPAAEGGAPATSERWRRGLVTLAARALTTPANGTVPPSDPEERADPGAAATRDERALDVLLAVRVVAVACALVAIVCGVLIPFAPVIQNSPQIRWPLDTQRPGSTMLHLTAYKPESLDARFSCRVAREADRTPDGYLLTTMAPTAPAFDESALAVRVRAGVLTVHTGGRDLVAEPLPPGDCRYEVGGNGARVEVRRDGALIGALESRLGTPDPDETQDVPPDSEPAPKPISPLPDVDALATSLRFLPGATADDLSVRITADDRYASTPTPLKRALIVAAIVAVVVGGAATTAAIALARRRDRWRAAPDGERGPPGWQRFGERVVGRVRTWRPRVVDAVVVAALISWLFLAPLTDDDGYYSAMAANVPASGYVANYYQLYNQGFTPFSWPYYVLSWWQQQAGFSPVALRVPSVVLGVVTWIAIRVFVARCPRLTHPWREHRVAAVAARTTLGVAFLTWWLPYDVGTRPEPWTAVFAAAALALVAEGVERERLDLLGGAVALGSVGLMTAPTGFICLAPLLAAAPTAWRVIRARAARWWEIPPRWLVVIAPGALGAVAGFADGTYGDFVRSQAIFAPIQRAETWYTEFARYATLLDQTSRFGTYAKRTAVLLCLLAIVWFLMTAVVARVRDLPVPRRLMLSGWTAILAFVLLLPTPSKPSHHFGAIAGVGAAFLALILVAGPGLVRASVRERSGRMPVPAVLAAAAAAIAVIALSGHGRNRWAFMWGLGQPSWLDYPSVKGFYFDQPEWWLVVLVVVTGVVALVTTRWWRSWRPWSLLVAIPVLCVLAMAATTTRTVADMALAAARTADTYSPAGDAWQDPSASRCGAERAIDVLDPDRVPLAPLVPLPPAADDDQANAGAFPRDAVLPTSPPPADLPPGFPVWGSFRAPTEGRTPDARTGTFTTGWFRLPPGGAGDVAVTTLVSGRLGNGNSLRLEYGRSAPTTPPVVVGSQEPDETRNAIEWAPLDVSQARKPPSDADLVRLVATDTTTDVGGWLAFTAPVAQRWIPMTTALPRDRVYTVAWQNSFLFPCIHQPEQRDGVTQTMDGFLGAGDSQASALGDFVSFPQSGGIVANAVRDAEVTPLQTRFRDFPETDDDVFLLLFEQPYPSGRYSLERTSRVVSGASP